MHATDETLVQQNNHIQAIHLRFYHVNRAIWLPQEMVNEVCENIWSVTINDVLIAKNETMRENPTVALVLLVLLDPWNF